MKKIALLSFLQFLLLIGFAATRTISDAGGNYNSTSAWVEGAAPTVSDDVVATSTSGNLTVNVAAVAKSIDFTNYSGTVTFNSTLTVSGNVTLVTAMTLAGSSALIVNAAATLTSNGKACNVPLTLSVTSTKNFTGNWTQKQVLTLSNTQTLSGDTIIVDTSFVVNNSTGSSGTGKLWFRGTGTWSGAGALSNQLIINTTGTLTLSGAVAYYAGTFNYVSGAVTTTGSTMTFSNGGTLYSSGITWNHLTFNGTGTWTLQNDIPVNGTLTVGSSNTTTVLNGYTIYAHGNLAHNNTSGTVSGSTNIVMDGTNPSWTSTFSAGSLKNNLTINISGTLAVSNVAYNTGVLYLQNGTINHTGMLTIAASTTLNTGSGSWNNVTLSATQTLTLSSALNINGTLSITGGTINFSGNNYLLSIPTLSVTGTTTVNLINDWTVSGNATLGGAATVSTLNNNKITISGNLSIGGTTSTVAGTTNIVMNGSGKSLSSSQTTGALKNNLEFNSGGSITISGTVPYNTGTLKRTAGTLTSGSGTIVSAAATTLDLNGATIAGLNINGAGVTVTLLSDLILASSLSVSGTSLSHSAFTAGSTKKLTLLQGASQDVSFCNATNINSGDGQTIWSYKGAIATSTNWNLLTPQKTIAVTF